MRVHTHTQSKYWRPASWMKPEAEGLSQCFQCWEISKQIAKSTLILRQKAERTSREPLTLTDLQITHRDPEWDERDRESRRALWWMPLIEVTRGQPELFINNLKPTLNSMSSSTASPSSSITVHVGVGDWTLFGLLLRSVHKIVWHTWSDRWMGVTNQSIVSFLSFLPDTPQPVWGWEFRSLFSCNE